jgi:polyphosphate kinase
VRHRVIDECLVPDLHATRDAWLLAGEGRYRRVSDRGVSAQQALLQRFGAEG